MISEHYRHVRATHANAITALLFCAGGAATAGISTAGDSASVSDAVWYAIPAAFLLGVLAALAIYSRLQGRRRSPAPRAQPVSVSVTAASTAAAAPTNVFLTQQGGDGVRHEITHTPFRIGRATERNEIALKHPSISRRHAQITVRKDGVYEITDMDSLNGLFVNDRKVKSSALADGDIIDVGDLTFRFSTRAE